MARFPSSKMKTRTTEKFIQTKLLVSNLSSNIGQLKATQTSSERSNFSNSNLYPMKDILAMASSLVR